MMQPDAPTHGPIVGEEFRDDLRPPGALNAQARKALSAQELQPFTQLDDIRSVGAHGPNGCALGRRGGADRRPVG